MTGTTDCPIWRSCADGRPDWWRPLAPNPWPGDENAYPCPWGCNGTGHRPEFRHIERGDCFSCGATGWILGRGQRSAPIKRGNSSRRKWRKEAGRLVPV